MLFPAKPLQSILMLMGQVRSQHLRVEHLNDASLRLGPVLLAKIRLGWKGLRRQTLAFYKHS